MTSQKTPNLTVAPFNHYPVTIEKRSIRNHNSKLARALHKLRSNYNYKERMFLNRFQNARHWRKEAMKKLALKFKEEKQTAIKSVINEYFHELRLNHFVVTHNKYNFESPILINKTTRYVYL